jgi:hypothetical protein
VSTYTPIASVTLSSAQSSVTFSGIPQTYTDLVLVASAKGSVNDRSFLVRFNSDTGSNYSGTYVFGSGSSASSGRYTSESSIRLGAVISNTNFDTYVVSMNNYSNSTTFKSVLSRENVSTIGVVAMVGLWRNTSAITTLDFLLNEGTFASGTTFNLYGVANASITNVAKATGGDSVYTDGTYWYHTFRSSGTFTPTQALTADYLVVAGGGAGGTYFGGGGGAGGLRCTITATGGGGSLESALSLTAQSYTVTVGAGGAGSNSVAASSGSNSVFSTITATGGGAGGAFNSNPSTGGSGGGGSTNSSSGQNGGAGTANQGYAGGNATWDGTNRSTAGGGGAGAVGSANSGASGGNGGAGVATSITGSSVTYAAGGGGCAYSSGSGQGSGGSSIGGNGGTRSTPAPTSGATNTGSGGGGAADGPSASPGGYAGGSGGSGIVIVRYAV